MRSPSEALAWLEQQRTSGSTAWDNMCESLCRQAYGLPVHYSSAELHAAAVPGAHRFGHEPLSRGDLVLYQNGGYGHIVIATGKGADVYTNDYGGRGRVTITDARNLASWCGAPPSKCYVSDAWWSSSNVQETHIGSTPATMTGDDDMAVLIKTKGGAGRHWLVCGSVAGPLDSGYRWEKPGDVGVLVLADKDDGSDLLAPFRGK